MADRVGQQLGNYRLTRLLGQGGFAEVYLGVHVYLDTPAAIKVLHTRLDSDEAEHFRTEARTIARLVHPHIVRVLEFGLEGTTPFLVVDYAPNGTLRKRYPREAPLPLPTIISYVKQIADALEYAHEQKVIHRDVKPENMLLGRRNEVLLSDFGIALVAQSTRYQSTQSMQDLAGTIAYMAPEQIQAQAVPNSDQYSLGVVVYEWLCGTRPFHGSFTEIAVKHTLVPPPPLREHIEGLSPALEAVVMKALAKDPNQRFPSVMAFALALEQVYLSEPHSQPLPLVTPTPPEQPASPAETILLAEPGVAPTVLLSGPDQPPAAPITTSPPENETPAPSLETADLGASLRTLPMRGEIDQPAAQTPVTDETPAAPIPPKRVRRRISRRAALLGLGGALAVAGAGGIAWLIKSQELQAMLALSTPVSSTGLIYVYRGHSALVWSVAWSPNGRQLVSGSSDKTAQVWNAADGNQLYTYTGHTDTIYGVAWSPNSRRVASASYDGTVQVWDATTGYYPFVYSGHSAQVWTVAWSPDGKRIASGGGDRTVQVWDASNGENVFIYRGHTGFVHSIAWSPDGKHIASSSSDGTVQVWDATGGSNPYVYTPYSTVVWGIAWSPDGKRIASACDNKTVQVWDAIGGDHSYIYYGHSDFVYTVAWSPNGQRIASGGDDKTVQVWDAVDGNNVFTYRGHNQSVRSVAWAPDGKRIASASWDKTVQIWQPQ